MGSKLWQIVKRRWRITLLIFVGLVLFFTIVAGYQFKWTWAGLEFVGESYRFRQRAQMEEQAASQAR